MLFRSKPTVATIDITLYTQKREGSHPAVVYPDECPTLWSAHHKELATSTHLYCPLDDEEACEGTAYRTSLTLHEAPRFALHYFRRLLYRYFKGRVAAIGYTYIGAVEVWVMDKKEKHTTRYHKYTLNVQHARVTEGFELLVT